MRPLISIIVPIYNVEQYLPKCIDSILSQTYSNLEIILVDDGSPDDCGRICDAYAEKDRRITVIHQKNGGVSSARNAGLKQFSGEYLMFIDPDDYISNDAVQSLYERMRYDGSDLVIGKHANVYENGDVDDAFCNWMEDAAITPADVFGKLKDKVYYPVSNSVKMYKRKLFDKIEYPALSCGEDVWVFPQLIEQCSSISVLNKTVYFYFQRPSSILHQKTEKSIRDDVDAVLHLVTFLHEKGYFASAYRWYEIAISKSLEMHNKITAVRLFEKYFDPKAMKALLKPQSIKTKLKWICLHVPVLFTIITKVKQLLGRNTR